ncbi:MAG TPA: multiheme c-type cytochrome [Blastocatellia bacterium]|nr:multiheme c-type cytochrome [Blastocatellia bacterium]
MRKIIASIFFTACLVGFSSAGSSASRVDQGATSENECVRCHSRLETPAAISSRFLDWRASQHAAAGVTCDQCHGGDPNARNAAKAHGGMPPPSNRNNKLHEQNAPETCGSCHRAVANAFVESVHFERLKGSELGPSCINCHGHMASSAARRSFEGESLCTFCHNTVNGLLPQRPDIVMKAKSTLDAITRTSYMVGWINELLAQADQQKLNVQAEKEELRLLRMALAEQKAGWHAFTLEGPMIKAGKTFDDSVKVKDSLIKKLGRQ